LRLLLLSFFIFFFTISLNADYIRSIRIGTFPTQSSAENSFVKLKEFISTHENIDELQSSRDFIFKVRNSGNYYVIVAEPFTERKILQEVLDTLRLEYKDIYVTKLKSMPKTIKKVETLDTIVEEIKPEVIPTREVEARVALEPKVEPVVENISQINSTPSLIPQKKSNTSLYLSFLLLLLIGVILFLVKYLFSLKKENERLLNGEMINEERLHKSAQDVLTKDNLLSHVSHELRTPMTAIMGLTHLVLESELTKLQKDYVEKIENSSQHLLNLVNDILDVSKIQAGELKIEKSEFNINNILDYVLSVNAMNAKRKGVLLTMDVEQNVPAKVLGDSLRLGQILINLIGNAVKFTQNGEVSLSLKVHSKFSDGIKFEFAISDTGIGMTEEQVSNVFNSYYQANDSTSREFGGTGLGLAISKELIEMMDGEIRVNSQKDVGTTFTFTVNLNLRDPDNQRHYRLPSSSMLNKKILIVDPSNKNVISLIKSLGYFNYEIDSIPSFEEDNSRLDVKEYDILIINQYNITNRAVEAIANIQKRNKIKLVVLSELYSVIESGLLENLEVDSYLQLPCSQQSVLNMIIDLYVAKNLDNRSRKITLKDKLKSMKNKKILVAEDNDINQKVIQGLLAQTGIELTFVDDGKEAVDLVHKNIHFDLLLMDINMPNMNGYEATREIRKNSRYNNLTILALTGDVMDDAVSKVVSSGMQGHISKPIIVDIFYKKIYEVLTNSEKNMIENSIDIEQVEEEDKEFNELSISVGLGRCHGDEEFYQSILEDFKTMYINSSFELKEFCDKGKFKEARRLAMDIKDVALNIGAYNLCESAATMEYEFEKGERSNWKEFISFYEIQLTKLFNEIDIFLKK
jgi:signal transduction histidine kinase/CheY-like chemotaxis protein